MYPLDALSILPRQPRILHHFAGGVSGGVSEVGEESSGGGCVWGGWQREWGYWGKECGRGRGHMNVNRKSQEPMRFWMRITILVLSSVLTLSYVISWALRGLGGLFLFERCVVFKRRGGGDSKTSSCYLWNICIGCKILTVQYLIATNSVTGKFIKTFTSTTSVESSLEAAADEVVKNEDKLRKMK